MMPNYKKNDVVLDKILPCRTQKVVLAKRKKEGVADLNEELI